MCIINKIYPQQPITLDGDEVPSNNKDTRYAMTPWNAEDLPDNADAYGFNNLLPVALVLSWNTLCNTFFFFTVNKYLFLRLKKIYKYNKIQATHNLPFPKSEI